MPHKSSEVSDMFDIEPRTLFVYESENLIAPERTPTQRRRYSRRDIERLYQVPDILQLCRDPAGHIILLHDGTHLLGTGVPFHRVHQQCALHRLSGRVDVEWIDRDGPFTKLLVGAGIL